MQNGIFLLCHCEERSDMAICLPCKESQGEECIYPFRKCTCLCNYSNFNRENMLFFTNSPLYNRFLLLYNEAVWGKIPCRKNL